MKCPHEPLAPPQLSLKGRGIHTLNVGTHAMRPQAAASSEQLTSTRYIVRITIPLCEYTPHLIPVHIWSTIPL